MLATGSIGIVETRYFEFAQPPNEMILESGAKLGPITLAYETYGQLNATADNAILITHALSGDAHVAGKHTPEDKKEGWWEPMVGPGKPFDTDKYFVICSNILGGCRGSTGPNTLNPATGREYGIEFPVITIGDMVRAQYELVQHLGVQRLLSVAGGSMGGMQALDWAVRYPDFVASAIVIASTHVSGAQQIAFDAVGRYAIQADLAFQEGRYYERGAKPGDGLAIARMLAHITYLSDQRMDQKFGRKLQSSDHYSYDHSREFSVETYLDHQGKEFVNRFDANTYLYVTKAMDYFDIATAHGSLDKALEQIRGRMLVLSFSSDWLYPPYQSEEIVYALTRQEKDVTYCCIQCPFGHDSFLLDFDAMGKLVSGFLLHASDPERVRTQLLEEDSETDTGPEPASQVSIYEGRRVDYDMIVDLVEENARVLDVGCGDGELLCRLIARKNVKPMGIELSQGNVVTCARRGIPVVQADVDKGIQELPDQCFDYVILSMTLQVIKKPDLVLTEMLRVGKKCIVSFPNFGYWKVRSKAFFGGRAPVTRNLPYRWYETPNRYVLSVRDFRNFCEELSIRIEKEIPLYSEGVIRFWPNFFAEEALYVITAQQA
ncbi:MAG: homoserine O-acetyltransferase [Candidatus Hydrogenedentes bacterium]|nr:homoserine O-acetyltransferase [Candidatus Hydrogenedentota bacterium]